MSAAMLSHSLPRSTLVGLAKATPLALRSQTGYPTSPSLALHLARSIATTSARPAAPSPASGSSLKTDDAKRSSEGPHPSDLQHSWRHTRPEEDWTARHAVYSPEGVETVKVVHRPATTTTDRLARGMVKMARWGFDFVTRYKHTSPEAAREAAAKAGKAELSVKELQEQGFILSRDQWMARILFLESVAGCPGMVGAVCRHLRSLRLMRRDGGFINTLLQEAENERMHLLVFMKVANPGPLFRLMVLGAQGIFFNALFFTYLLSPTAVHRFVGYLEEEAVVTYTNVVNELKLGHIPEWAPGQQEVPNIAKDYWRLGDDATMLDLILAVRADEAGHRFTNHTLANLDKDDFNPLAMKHAPPEIEGATDGFTREQSKDWIEKVKKEMHPEDSQAKKQEADK